MALKRLITKEDHVKLSKELQTEYKASEDGSGFVLDLTDYEDPGALKRAKDHEKEQRKAAEKLAKEREEQLIALTEERDGLLRGAIPKADVEKLEGSYKNKMAAREKELGDKITSMTASMNSMLVDNVATTLAAKISISPEVILPHITRRLKAEQGEDGKFMTRVLDSEGKPSALTVGELEKEFVANKAFAPLLIGSKGSGGGSHGAGGGGGATGGKIDFSASPTQIAAQLKASGKLVER